jgi:hypothetical protein
MSRLLPENVIDVFECLLEQREKDDLDPDFVQFMEENVVNK